MYEHRLGVAAGRLQRHPLVQREALGTQHADRGGEHTQVAGTLVARPLVPRAVDDLGRFGVEPQAGGEREQAAVGKPQPERPE